MAVCVICDGGSEEDLLKDEFVRIAMNGFVMAGVESSVPWVYTIGLMESFDHPELVMMGPPLETSSHLIAGVVGRINAGERFSADSPPMSPCKCTVGFGPVHPAQWGAGRFDQWLRYYDWVGGEWPEQDAIQVLWSSKEGRFPPDPLFCPHGGACQPLLNEAPRHNVNIGENREQRRRRKYGHGKRRLR